MGTVRRFVEDDVKARDIPHQVLHFQQHLAAKLNLFDIKGDP
jgi:hypothetical protein